MTVWIKKECPTVAGAPLIMPAPVARIAAGIKTLIGHHAFRATAYCRPQGGRRARTGGSYGNPRIGSEARTSGSQP
jgi:hypothetical protein